MQAIQTRIIRKTTLYIIYSIIVILFIALTSVFFNNSFAHAESLSYHVSVEESLNVTVKPSNVSIDLNPETKQFGIANLAVSVGTNYINGYKLYINSTSTNLTNNDYVSTGGPTFYIPTLSSSTVASSFPANYWGYRISSGNSGDPSITNLDSSLSSSNDATFHPFTSGTLVSSSPTAINENNTTLTFGAKADYDKPAGSYTNTFSFNATANPVTYSITYTDNTGDSTVTNLPTPNPASGMIAGTIIPVSSIVPERTGYTFKSWCKGTVSGDGTVCTGTEFNAGSNIDLEADKITDTTFTLTAVWTVKSYLQTVQVRYQNTSGGWGSYSTYSACTKNVNYNSTHSCSIAATTEYQAASLASYTVTGTTTKYIDVYRNTRTVTLSKGTGISAVSFSGTGVVPNTTSTSGSTTSAKIYYGGAITIIATMASTYTWVNWTGSATYSNRSQSISNVTGNLSFTANGRATTFNDAYGTTGTKYMQNMTSSICAAVNNGQTTTLTDNRTGSYTYTVAKINDACWMTQNLRLGYNSSNPNTTSISINSSNTNINTSKTLTLYDLVTYGSSGKKCYGDDTGAGDGYTYLCIHTGSDSDGKTTVWYNYAAATAGTITGSSNTTNATYSICPKGWRLPTISEETALANHVTQFKPTYGGHYGNGTLRNADTIGYWWASGMDAAYAAQTRNNIYYESNILKRNNSYRHFGKYVRCIAQ